MTSTSNIEDIKNVPTTDLPRVELPLTTVQLTHDNSNEVASVRLHSDFTPYVVIPVVLDLDGLLNEKEKTRLLKNIGIECSGLEIKLETLCASQDRPVSVEYHGIAFNYQGSVQDTTFLESQCKYVFKKCWTLNTLIIVCSTLPKLRLVLKSIYNVLTPEKGCNDVLPGLRQITLVRGLDFEKTISFVPISPNKFLGSVCVDWLYAILKDEPDTDLDKSLLNDHDNSKPPNRCSKFKHLLDGNC